MSYLDELKKNRGKSLEDLNKRLAADKSKKAERQEDDRFWQPTTDKAGNAFSVIRFLPRTSLEVFPFVQEIKHNFNNPANKRYVNELCPTLFQKPCPICESNSVLWEAGNKGVVSGIDGKNGRKRIIKYISNILVVNDPAAPENNGKVKLYRYGSQIFKKWVALANPEEGSGDTPVDVFCPWGGANLKLKVVKVSGFPNYNESLFSAPAPIGTDEVIESVLSQMVDLSTIISPSHLKSYDELKEKLDHVLNVVAASSEEAEEVEEGPSENLAAAAGFKEEPVQKTVEAPPIAEKKIVEADQEVEDYFNNLTEE